MNNDINTPHQSALNAFIAGVNKKIEAYWLNNGFTFNTPPVVGVVSTGKRYAKLGKFEQIPHKTGPFKCNSVYCFFDIATGDLLKGSWKAPVANGVRGNVNEANVLDKFTQHGPAYLR